MWESLRIGILGEGTTSLPRVEPGGSFVCQPYASSWSAQRVKFLNHKDKSPSISIFFYDLLVDLKKKMLYVHMWYIFYCYCIAGHSLGTLMYLKTKIINISHLRGFLQLLQKVQVSGLFFFDSVFLGQFATLRAQLLNVVIIKLKFWSSTGFFLLIQNNGMCSNIFLSMSAVTKKASEKIIRQFNFLWCTYFKVKVKSFRNISIISLL